MKTISIILLVAAVIQITLTAPASDVATTTITPLGPMDMDQLVEYYVKDKYHRYDVLAPEAISLIKALLEKLDDIIASPDNSGAETDNFKQFKSYFADFLKDVEADTTECGLKKVGNYNHHVIRDFVKSADNEKLRDLFKSFDNVISDSYRAITRVNTEFIHNNEALLEEIHNKVKFSTRCCKYWHDDQHKTIINGEC